MPASKPVWLTEIGCPAVDKGATEPYRFPDPRSVEGGLPRFSTGARDDAVQRAFLSAHIEHWTGSANADGMVDPARVFAWTWDARPYPTFPSRSDLWSDFDNWRTGHWLNGRFGGASLADLFADVLTRAGIERFDVSGIAGAVTGHATAGGGSPRDVLEPLMAAFAIDMREGPQGLEFASRLKAAVTPLVLDVVADPDDAPRFEESREQESTLPGECVLRFFDPLSDHAASSARSRRLAEGAVGQTAHALDIAFDDASAAGQAELWLKDRWAGRRSLLLTLPPSRVEVEPGDLVRCAFEDAPEGLFRIERIEDGAMRRIEARGHALPLALDAASAAPVAGGDASAGFLPDLVLADLPLISGGDESAWAVAAAHMKPWRALVVSAASGSDGYAERSRLDAPARIGRLAAPLPPGTVEGRFDAGSDLLVDLPFGGFESLSRQAVLDGGNAIAVETGTGWEILQFETAEEIMSGRWRLTSLLRGQAGTDDAMREGATEGARTLLLDRSLRPLGIPAEEAGLARNYLAELAGRGSAVVAGPVSFAGGLRARTPFSPVHLNASRTAAGVRFSWIRRGRSPEADSWNAVEIPLLEETERYRLTVLDGGAEIRVAETGTAEWLYPAADELADFGVERDAFDLRVEQGGRSVPWGVARPAHVTVL